MRLCVVLVFAVSVFSIAKCLHVDELILNPASVTQEINKEIHLGQQRIKRQAFRLGQRTPYLPPVGVQPRAPTVIVVPERGASTVPVYGTGPISPYSVNTPNRGTTVVVSQVPEYYNSIGRSYDVMPISPIRI